MFINTHYSGSIEIGAEVRSNDQLYWEKKLGH